MALPLGGERCALSWRLASPEGAGRGGAARIDARYEDVRTPPYGSRSSAT